MEEKKNLVNTISESSPVRLGLAVLIVLGVWSFGRQLSGIEGKADTALQKIEFLQELVTLRIDTAMADKDQRISSIETRLTAVESELRAAQSERNK